MSIAHAIFSAHDAMLAYEVSWDGRNYSRNDSQGTRGTVTFIDDNAIGLFFDLHSKRSPFRKDAEYSLQTILGGMATNLRKTAEDETSQYLLQNLEGRTIPVVTAAFWSIGGTLQAKEPWRNVLDNGAYLIRTETLDSETAMQEISDDYEFSTDQMSLIRSLFERRLGTEFEKPIRLTETDMKILVQQGNNGLEASQELLEAVHIILPQ